MALAHLTDMVATAKRRVLAQYQGLTARLVPGIGAIVGLVQQLEDQFWALYQATFLATATDIWLDYLGNIVGQPRQGLADGDYRACIYGRIIANRSDGKVEDLIAICRAVLQLPALNPIVIEQTLTSVYLEIPIAHPVDYNDGAGSPVTPIHLRPFLERLLGIAKAGGVKLQVFTYPVGGPVVTVVPIFELGDSTQTQPQIDATHGLGDSTEPGPTFSGGGFASCNNV
jgi:hypothetical protein